MNEILQLTVETFGDLVLELSEELDQLILVVEGLLAQDTYQGLDSLVNDPRLDFRLDGGGDTGDGVGGDSASEERLEVVVDMVFLEGLNEGLEVGEVLGEGGEVQRGWPNYPHGLGVVWPPLKPPLFGLFILILIFKYF